MSKKDRGLFMLEDNIKDIMEFDELARGCDAHLYVEVLKVVNPSVLNVPFKAVMENFGTFEIPTIESVGRVRRKVQSECPWLLPADRVRKFRADNEQVFQNYALEVR